MYENHVFFLPVNIRTAYAQRGKTTFLAVQHTTVCLDLDLMLDLT